MRMVTSFVLHPVAPFRLDYTVWALRRRSKNIIDRWDGKQYSRLFVIDNEPIKVMVEQRNTLQDPEILVSTNIHINKVVQVKLIQLLETMLGLKCDLQDFYKITNQDAHLKSLARQFSGLKPPRFPSVFEALVNAISCQQISLDAGLQIQNRLVQYIDVKVNDKGDVIYAFPSPHDISNCSVPELKQLGYSAHKSETLIQLGMTIKENQLVFDHLESQPNNAIIHFLCQFKGIGRWSAEYVLLRGLGKLAIFPGDDVGAQKNLQQLLHLDSKPDYQKISKITAKWYPYAGLIYFHLLLHKLQEKGLF